MDRLREILRCQWRAYWRRFARSGNLNAGNQGILLIVSFLALFKYVSVLRVASVQLANGRTSMFESVLLGIFLAWLFPLMSNSRLSVTTQALKHLPLTPAQLLVVRSASLFIPPFSWLIVGGSLAIAYPLLFAPNPLSGTVAAFLFIVFSWFFGLTITQLLSVAFWRRIVLAAFVLAILTGAYLVKVRGWRYSEAFPFMPATLVASAATGDMVWLQLLVLAISTALAACTALWSFQLSLDHVESSALKKQTHFSIFRDKTGPLSAKDIRYFRRLFDPYLGLLSSALGCLYLVVADAPTGEVFWIFILIVFFPNASLTFNAFGLDNRSASDRYTLLPLSGQEIIWSKNRAYAATVLVQLFPLFALAVMRIGVGAALLGLIEVLLLTLGYLCWGNLVAVNHRVRMQFYRFSSGGSPVEALVGVIVGSLPGAIAIQLFQAHIWWVSLPVLILYGTMYWASLIWAGRQWKNRSEAAWSN
jgi:hypothetical protein